MSKLLSKLEKISRGSSTPLGFGAASRIEKTPSMALVGLLTQNYSQGVSRLVKVDADGALFTGEDMDVKIAGSAGNLKKVPWGIRVNELDSDRANRLIDEGCDFFVTNPERIMVDAIMDDKAAYLLSLPPGPEESLLRTIEDLPVDAVYMSLNPWESRLTLEHLINISSARTMFDKYLLVEVPATLSYKELESLRDVGVDALGVDAGRSSEKVLTSLKEKLFSLPRQRKSRPEKLSAFIPQGVHSQSVSPYEEDDED